MEINVGENQCNSLSWPIITASTLIFKAVATVPALTFNFNPKMPVNKCYQLEQTIHVWCTLPLFQVPKAPQQCTIDTCNSKNLLQCILLTIQSQLESNL